MLRLLLIATALAGCTSSQGYAPAQVNDTDRQVQRQAMMSALKDPNSAEVEDVRVYQNPEGNRMTCSKVNGRNSFGGFSGFQVLMTQTINGVDYSKPFNRPISALGAVASIDCAGAGYPI
jgi:hypothetical protein